MFFFGDWISAEKAEAWGLANAVVPQDQLLQEAMKWAERLVLYHPAPLKLAKKVVNHHIRAQLDSILATEQEHIMVSLGETGGPPKMAQWMKDKKKWMDEVKSKL